MPASGSSSYATTSATLNSAPHSRKPSFSIPGVHASALPQYGEYVTESPSSVAATAASSMDQEDYVFCDPVAFRYIEDDPCASVICRQRFIHGYEIYLVEQWACSRTHPTFVICTYTGDSSHRISVSVLRIPKDETLWSRKLSVYFEAVRLYNARPKETELGTMMVTNLSSFPSALTVIPVLGGDVKQHRMDFIVNENLKQMGCSGRSMLSLTMPTDASQTKFHQSFRTSDRIPFYSAVVELVRLCQLALMVFGKLKRNSMYADGLLCDVTEKGIRDWWAEFGTDFYNVEPNDGTLGPSTVSGLLGMVLGARNRLSVWGAPVPKDAFDLPQLEKGILYFQRQQRMERTGRLDRATMDRLQRYTMKSGPSADIFAVPRAIKSTVADLSARAVGSSSGSVDSTAVETVDIDRFVRYLSGESCKFLWQGKPRKTGNIATGTQSHSTSRRNSFEGKAGSLSGDEESSFISGVSNNRNHESSESPTVVGTSGTTGHSVRLDPSNTFQSVESGKDATVSDLRKAVFRSMTGRMKDVASNISAGADYVRGRGHQKAFVKDLGLSFGEDNLSVPVSPTTQQSHFPPFSTSSTRSVKDGKAVTTPPSPNANTGTSGIQKGGATTGSPSGSLINIAAPWSDKFPDSLRVPAGEASVGSSINDPESDESNFADAEPKLIRRKSLSDLQKRRRHEAFFPNRLSFSLAAEAVLTWNLPFSPPNPALVDHLDEACDEVVEWSRTHISHLQDSLSTLDASMIHLKAAYESNRLAVGVAQRDGLPEIESEREKIRDAIREAEILGARMQYELDVVQGKLLDLEESVANLAKFVHEVEIEMKGLGDEENVGKKKGWFAWFLGR